MKILIIDDSPTQLAMMEKWVSKEGHSVDTCETFESAVDLISESKNVYDVIIIDVVMPVTHLTPASIMKFIEHVKNTHVITISTTHGLGEINKNEKDLVKSLTQHSLNTNSITGLAEQLRRIAGT